MNHRARPSRRAFTLLEAVLSIVIIGIIAATVAPTISGAADSYAHSSAARARAERTGYALERAVRLIRDIPLDDATGNLAATGDATSLRLTDGRALYHSGTSLYMLDTNGAEVLLCKDVDALSLAFLADDGRTASTAPLCQRIHITVTSGELVLSAAVLPRVRMTP